MAETVFETINLEQDKNEQRKRAKNKLKFNQEEKGMGIEGFHGADHWKIGSFRILSKTPTDPADVYIMKNNECVATLYLKDQTKTNFRNVIQYFNQEDISTSILSGDRAAKVKAIATEIGVESYQAEVLPKDKHDIIQQKKSDRKPDKKTGRKTETPDREASELREKKNMPTLCTDFTDV